MRRTLKETKRLTAGDPGENLLPPGTPSWITVELVRETIQVWQPFYKEALTPDDAVAMLRGVGRMFEVLSRK